MNATMLALVKGFIDRLVYGTALDDCGNRDDDSMIEMAYKAKAGGDEYTYGKLRELQSIAIRLQTLLAQEQGS